MAFPTFQNGLFTPNIVFLTNNDYQCLSNYQAIVNNNIGNFLYLNQSSFQNQLDLNYFQSGLPSSPLHSYGILAPQLNYTVSLAGQVRQSHNVQTDDMSSNRNISVGTLRQNENENNHDSQHPEHVLQPRSPRGRAPRARGGEGYYWTEEENQRYLDFVDDHRDLLLTRYEERTKFRVNVAMSRRVRTRSAVQCHNHHYKMLGRHGGLENLLATIDRSREGQQQQAQEGSEQV